MKWLTAHKNVAIDLVERTFATFGQAFLAVVIVNQGTLTQITALETGAAAGGLAVAKFLLVKANAFLSATPPAAGK